MCDDLEQIRLLVKNLKEKKTHGVLSALDRQLLQKIQKVVEENPRNYSSKIGYLQMLYEK